MGKFIWVHSSEAEANNCMNSINTAMGFPMGRTERWSTPKKVHNRQYWYYKDGESLDPVTKQPITIESVLSGMTKVDLDPQTFNDIENVCLEGTVVRITFDKAIELDFWPEYLEEV